MAAIYDANGNAITEGLQGSTVCDAAAQAAVRIAKRLGRAVYLSDDDGDWIVRPDGSIEDTDESPRGDGEHGFAHLALCQHCDGSGEIAVRTTFPCSYAGPGPVPEDARGVIGRRCDECGGTGTVREREG